MSKKKNKKSNPHSAPQPKAKSTQPAKKSNPLVWGIGAIVVVAILIIAAVADPEGPFHHLRGPELCQSHRHHQC